MQTYTGQCFDPQKPEEYTYTIEEIAHVLAGMPRFGGHTNVPYTVAEHSVYVSEVVPPAYQREGLMHDAAEAYVLDMPQPIKVLLRDYNQIIEGVERQIAKAFDLRYPWPDVVRQGDMLALSVEKRDVVEDWGLEWAIAPAPSSQPKICALNDREKAKTKFLLRAQALGLFD